MAWVNEFNLTLPSGNTPKIKRIDLMSLLVRKKGIPSALLPIVEKQINPKRGKKKSEIVEDMDNQDDAEMSMFLDWLCTKVFVSPMVYEELTDIPELVDADKEYILTEQISLEDKLYILAWEMGGDSGVAAMEFRKQSVLNVANLRNSEDIPEVA